MALERIQKKTLFQRVKTVILGKEKPNLITRISVISGFVIWVYLFSGQLLTYLALLMHNTLSQSTKIKGAYTRVGKEMYGLGDPIALLKIHSLIQIIIYVLILAGLILIWRKKKLGFALYIVGFAISLFVSFILMGWKFMAKEILFIDYILILGTVIYFAIGLFLLFDRNNTTKEVTPLQS